MTAMTPKTQSVCKHCGKEITPCMSPNRTSVNPCKGWIHARDGWHTCAGKYAEPVAEPASTLKGLDPELYEQAANRVVELHEPASTGEPQSCPCPCHKGESVICNCGGGFECEYINSIPAARPSEPSAPQTSAEHLKKCVKEGPDCDCVTVCKFDSPQPSGDAPKVEEIKADNLFGVYCNGNPESVPKDRAIYWEGWQKVADYVNRLRRYFPPASQKENLCGTANVPTLTSEGIHHIAKTAEPFEAHHLPNNEWQSLSKESREKISKWFSLAEKYLQSILDEEEAPPFKLPDELLGGAVKVIRPTDLRNRVGMYMLEEHGLHIGSKVDAGKVQDMIEEFTQREIGKLATPASTARPAKSIAQTIRDAYNDYFEANPGWEDVPGAMEELRDTVESLLETINLGLDPEFTKLIAEACEQIDKSRLSAPGSVPQAPKEGMYPAIWAVAHSGFIQSMPHTEKTARTIIQDHLREKPDDCEWEMVKYIPADGVPQEAE